MARRGMARCVVARLGEDWHGAAVHGLEGRGWAWRGAAWYGWTRGIGCGSGLLSGSWLMLLKMTRR